MTSLPTQCLGTKVPLFSGSPVLNVVFITRASASRVMGLAWCPCIYYMSTKKSVI